MKILETGNLTFNITIALLSAMYLIFSRPTAKTKWFAATICSGAAFWALLLYFAL